MSDKASILSEFTELSERIALLKNYIHTKTTSNKTEDEVLERQLNAMLEYRNCLVERIIKMLGE